MCVCNYFSCLINMFRTSSTIQLWLLDSDQKKSSPLGISDWPSTKGHRSPFVLHYHFCLCQIIYIYDIYTYTYIYTYTHTYIRFYLLVFCLEFFHLYSWERLVHNFISFLTFLCIDFRERERKGKRERERIGCFIYLCTHWLILVCSLMGDQTRNLGLSGWCSNQLSQGL